MIVKQLDDAKPWLRLLFIFGVIISLAGCNTTILAEEDVITIDRFQTSLLVRPPDTPLPINRPITVRSRTEDPTAVSHVELYAVQTPSGESNILIRSDQAPFTQKSFTAAQTFTPIEQGHYVIKVVGYNQAGQKTESDFLGFDVQ